MESCQENRSRGSQQVSLEFIAETKKQFAEENNLEGAVAIQSLVGVVDDYLHKPVLPQKSNPLLYRKEKQLVWSILAKMARKYPSKPPASVPSERLFSTAGQIATEINLIHLKCYSF